MSSKKIVQIELSDDEMQYIERMAGELELGSPTDAVLKIVREQGKEWFDTTYRQRFLQQLEAMSTEELVDVISSLPYLSRRYGYNFDEDALCMIVEKLAEWDGSVPRLIKNIYRMNNINISSEHEDIIINELTRINGDPEDFLSDPLFHRKELVKMLVLSLYSS